MKHAIAPSHVIITAILSKPERLGRALYQAKCDGKLGLIVKSTKVNKEKDYAITNSKTK